MLKFRKKLQKGFGNIPFHNFLRSVSIFLFFILTGCAEHAPQQPVPHVPPLENPANLTGVASDEDYNNGYADYQKGDFEKARKEFQKELKKNSGHYPSYLGIAYTYLADKQLGDAEKYIRKSLDIHADYPQAHFAMAHLQELQQNYDAALGELDQVAQLNPDYPSIQESRSVMKLKATEFHMNEAQKIRDSDPDAALQHLKAAQQLAPEVASVPIDIATILIKQEKCSEAIPYLQTAIERAPDNSDVKQELAACLTETKDYKGALSVYEQLSSQHPENNELRAKLQEARRLVFVETLPDEYQQIPQTPEITRAQFAALIIVNLEFLQNYSSASSQILVDTINHWAKNFILKVVALGIVDAYPNRTFEPDATLTRLELAKAASRILEIVESNGHSKTLSGNPQAIPDVPSSSLYYAMIAKALSAGMLTLDNDGNFHANRSVSGAEALSLINRIKQLSE